MAAAGEGVERPLTRVAVREEGEEDPPSLSARTLEALKEFLAEQRQQQQQSGDPSGDEEEDAEDVRLVTEDWRLSQFWYDRETSETVALEVAHLCAAAGDGEDCPVACIACPTLYAYLKKIAPSISVQLLEYDRRFEQYGGDFTFYDYNRAVDLPLTMHHGFRVVIADPPYLSKECLEKVAQTILFLARPLESYLLLLTGAVQEDIAAELLNVQPCGFRPKHSSKLGNEFRLFTNYDPEDRLGGWE